MGVIMDKNKRDYTRYDYKKTGVVEINNESYKVEVLDLSILGMRISNGIWNVGEELKIKLDDSKAIFSAIVVRIDEENGLSGLRIKPIDFMSFNSMVGDILKLKLLVEKS